jgi:hypothetical protein
MRGRRTATVLRLLRPFRTARLAARYRPSHRPLLADVAGRPAKCSELPLGCIFLPINRPLGQRLPGLELAVELAAERDCYLVVLCSDRARSEDFPKALAARLNDRLIVINQAKVHLDWKPQLESSKQRLGRFHRDNDAAEKRNLGLALASVLGWRTVLFMDDDISPTSTGPTLDAVGLARALATLNQRPQLRAVGWRCVDMDDHSVIGHARKLVRMGQDRFVGAGALLVKCDQRAAYFPNLYNHDWIFLIMLAKKAVDPRRAIGSAGTVAQLDYDPFIPRRARSEEAGDVIGECLMNLLEDHGADFETHATTEFWAEALRLRRELVLRLHTTVGRRARRAAFGATERLQRVQRALVAAEEVNRDLTAADLTGYIAVLRADERRWEAHLEALSSAFVNPPEPRRVLLNLQSGKPPAANWKSALLPCVPAQDSMKETRPRSEPSARPAESDVQAASGVGDLQRWTRLRWRKGFYVRQRQADSASGAASQLALEPAAALPERKFARIDRRGGGSHPASGSSARAGDRTGSPTAMPDRGAVQR